MPFCSLCLYHSLCSHHFLQPSKFFNGFLLHSGLLNVPHQSDTLGHSGMTRGMRHLQAFNLESFGGCSFILTPDTVLNPHCRVFLLWNLQSVVSAFLPPLAQVFPHFAEIIRCDPMEYLMLVYMSDLYIQLYSPVSTPAQSLARMLFVPSLLYLSGI